MPLHLLLPALLLAACSDKAEECTFYADADGDEAAHRRVISDDTTLSAEEDLVAFCEGACAVEVTAGLTIDSGPYARRRRRSASASSTMRSTCSPVTFSDAARASRASTSSRSRSAAASAPSATR